MSILLLLLLFVALGALIIVFTMAKYWIIGLVVVAILVKPVIKLATNLVRSIRGEKVVVMFQKDLDKNYVPISKVKKVTPTAEEKK